ncbi:SDR family NAD(P)-dependent oxidoreductase [Sporolactobacillus laevolacticus]|uniref:SDR family NAD(P)-dependent oxidoreductase n=1 Tax=Sporolactobacillus laevolacticus TaxID=33018 RepID=UPI0025B4E903|nr:SDR family NAD(P)-dependent oxidoreductase [Sporolactobacillus laevolacticus]MDN3955957.1 SDR family NAD(P)-dependent oxidoreductase [Sporolactobacillus laevolacticus]
MNYVLITGGTTGIGYELARCFLQDNYGVVIVGADSQHLNDAKVRLEKEFNVSILIYQQDLSKIGAALELFGKITNLGIDLSVLVNNAGFGLVGGTEQIDFQQDEKMMVLNMISLVELSKLFITNMYNQRSGRILNVSSVGAFQPGPYTSTYFASKSFVLNYSRAIRYEAKEKGISISVLCPGSTKTNFFNREGTRTPKNAMSPEKVAGYAYKKLMNGKEVIIPGFFNKLWMILPDKVKMTAIAGVKKRKN